MFKNYLNIALRILLKNRFYAAINIVSLGIGLAIFIFSQVLSDYEQSYDLFFDSAENIYVPFVLIAPTAPIGIRVAPAPTPTKQLLEGVEGVEKISFAITDQVVMKIDDDKFYQFVRFLDPSFFDIFNFNFLFGNAKSALTTPNTIAISESTALKYFAPKNPIGQIITINAVHDFTVGAVFRDLPKNSHFVSSFSGPSGFEMAANMDAYKNLTGFDGVGQWGSLSTTQGMYLSLAPGLTLEQIYERVDARFESQTPVELQDFLEAIRFREVSEMNLFPWKASGIPGVLVMQLLGFVVLLVVVLNYSNLAYAQALGRAHEVGVRKALGASRSNIFYQFIMEGIVLSAMAGFLAIVVIGSFLPLLNTYIDRNIEFNFITEPSLLFLVIGTILTTGVIAGIYPAIILTRLSVVKIISGAKLFGGSKNWAKNSLLVFQLTVSVVLMTIAAVITYQNSLLESTSKQYDLENIVNIKNVRSELFSQYSSFRLELENIPGVDKVSAASQIPFEQNQSMFSLGRTRMADDEVIMQTFSVDEEYIDIFDVNIIAGRTLLRAREDMISQDDYDTGVSIPVIINQTAVADLGFSSPDQAIGELLLPHSDEDKNHYQIIGIMEDRNYSGLFGSLKPLMFYLYLPDYDVISLSIDGENYNSVITEIRRIWDNREPEFPMIVTTLKDEFEENYQMLKGINMVVIFLASLAVLFTLAGLFGLVAYIAGQRTREFAIRKVMGAHRNTLIKLVMIQFSIPVMIALIIGMPIAVFATDAYLELFVERVSLGVLFFAVPATAMLVLTWGVVLVHAIRVARTKPALALRSE